MERLKLRAFVLGGVLLLAGAGIQAMPKPKVEGKDEAFMMSLAPTAVGEFKFEPSELKPGCSYDVDQRTYDLLKPFGVVGRVYSDGKTAYDVMLISGNDKNSFHDNRVCFQGQGYSIVSQTNETLDTKRGQIPITFLDLESKEFGKAKAAMFYKGPHGKWFPLPSSLTWAMFVEQLKLGNDLDSTFYRIMPRHANPNMDEFKQFIRDYLVEAEKTSKGFF